MMKERIRSLVGSRKRKLIVGGAVGFLFLLAVGWYVIQPAMEVDGIRYSRDEVSKMTAYPVAEGMSGGDAKKALFEYLITSAAARKANVMPTEDEITQQMNKQFTVSTKAPLGEWGRLAAIDTLVKAKLSPASSVAAIKEMKGYALMFNFDDKIATEENTRYRPKGYGDKVAIEQDRQYAKSKADYFRSAIQNKSLSPADAIKQIKADPRLGFMNTANTNASTAFGDINQESPNSLLPNDVRDFIKSTDAPTGLSEIRTGKIAIKGQPVSASDYADAYYYFTVIESGAKTTNQLKTKYDAAYKEIKDGARI